MSREWTQRDHQKSWLTGNLKDEKNKAVPEEPGKMGYTECPRRNVPDFGRVFLMLKYTDITQNTYNQSWTVTEIMAREKCGLLAVSRTAPVQLTRYLFSWRVTCTLRMSLRMECSQHCACVRLLSDFNETWFLPTYFRKILKYQI